ncbi:UNVERIFIED_CONTAM: protein SPIRRIG [Sesamum radiatum]|uniref:Protein SPIRRIG n=1 Tax=Sesamum radiatum TaxID=300843 RepID=A0AAW2UP95_SESRA
MKWVTLFKVFKDKVGLSPIPSSASTSPPLPFEESSSNANNASPPRQDFSLLLSRLSSHNAMKGNHVAMINFVILSLNNAFPPQSTAEKGTKVELIMTLDPVLSEPDQLESFAAPNNQGFFSPLADFDGFRDKTELELDFKRYWEEFGSSSTEKDGIRPGANLLQAVEILVSGLVDKQSFLDSGIFCCLIHVLNALLAPDGGSQRQQLINNEEQLSSNENHDVETRPVRRHEFLFYLFHMLCVSTNFQSSGTVIASSVKLYLVEGSVIHIMKALAGHPSAAQSLVDDNSLQLLFQMVANGSSVVFSQYKEGLVPLHTIQLHRHAMQILRLLLVNDNGSTAKYIRKHQLIRVLLMAVKDFNPDCGDPAYTVGIVDLLLESVELSYRPDAGGIRLREDIHNAHGYQFLVQFALTLSKSQGGQTFYSKSLLENDSAKDSSHAVEGAEKKNLGEDGRIYSPLSLSPALSRLLDVIISFAQTGSSCAPGSSGLKSSKSSHPKSNAHGRSRSSFSDRMADEILEKDNEKVKDLEAVQMLLDILIKAESTELQAEVLNRLLKIFSSHPENYKLCQQLRTVPLLILNMAGFPSSLQEIILKILEYAVSVVNIIPEQELLSLCCLLQQSITSELKHTILSFFLKLLSFDQEYKKILREVGVLELLLEDLKQHTFLHEPEQLTSDHGQLEIKN